MPTRGTAAHARLSLAHDLPIFVLFFLLRIRAKVMNLFAYPTYQAFADMMLPIRHGAALVNHSLNAWPAFGETSRGRSLGAACDLLTLAGLTPVRPPFGIDSEVADSWARVALAHRRPRKGRQVRLAGPTRCAAPSR